MRSIASNEELFGIEILHLLNVDSCYVGNNNDDEINNMFSQPFTVQCRTNNFFMSRLISFSLAFLIQRWTFCKSQKSLTLCTLRISKNSFVLVIHFIPSAINRLSYLNSKCSECISSLEVVKWDWKSHIIYVHVLKTYGSWVLY